MSLRLNYEVTGNPDGEVLMLLHGYMSSNSQWDLNREHLGQHLCLVLVEQIGHGRSPAPEQPEWYEREHTLQALEQIRAEVGIERWWVGGHSLGGAVAIRYALANPDTTKGLLFTNTRAAFGISRPKQADGKPQNPLPANRHDIPFHPIHAKRYPEDLKAKLVAEADAMADHALVLTSRGSTIYRSVDDMHTLAMPTLLITGRWEKLFRPCVPQARQAIPDFEVVELEGGHSINIEQPEGFNHAVIDFIARHDG